jgi:Transglycosylase SLT domain
MRSVRHHAVIGRSTIGRRVALLLLTGLTVVSPGGALAQVQVPPAPRSSSSDPYAGFIGEAARRFDIPEGWIRAILRVESHGDAHATSPKGAIGLMQIMPATWTEMRARWALGNDPYEPRDNILAGTAYLREMHDRYGSPGFLAAYNAGPGRYEDYRATGHLLPAETRAYVATLTPIISGDELTSVDALVAADARAWTRAPLFIGHTENTAPAAPKPSADLSPAPSIAHSERGPSSIGLLTGGLFVMRTESAELR